MLFSSRIGEGEELKAPRHTSAAATRDYTWYIPNNNYKVLKVVIIYKDFSWLVRFY